jgi:Skp family chaperone for outer membrane proteins
MRKLTALALALAFAGITFAQQAQPAQPAKPAEPAQPAQPAQPAEKAQEKAHKKAKKHKKSSQKARDEEGRSEAITGQAWGRKPPTFMNKGG